MSESVSTVIVAPSALLREGIASILQDTHYKVVAAATDPVELAHLRCPINERTLGIIVAFGRDAKLEDAAECIRLLRSCMPGGKLVLVAEMTGPVDRERLPAADACIVNLGSREILMKVLELTLLDQCVCVFGRSKPLTGENPETAKQHYIDGATKVSRDPGRLRVVGQSALSAREYEMLFYLAEGKSNKAIARLCNISEATIKVRLKSILRKTNTKNRVQAAIWAIENGVRNHSLEHSKVADAPTLSPAGATLTSE